MTYKLMLKLEVFNPTGSVKYRTAVGLLRALDAERPLRPGSTVVESTSGNLGVALSMLVAQMGCRFVGVVDPKTTPEARQAMTTHGAALVEVSERDIQGGYLLTRLSRVYELLQEDPGLRWTNQYENPANPTVHRLTLVRELLEQTGSLLDAVFVAVSTGGTLVGVSEGIRVALGGVRMYAVDVHGSRVTSNTAYQHLLTGIGAGRRSSFMQTGHYEMVLRVHDFEAIAYCRLLLEDTGLALGGSSGAVLAAFCGGIGSKWPPPSYPVAIMPDGAARYVSTVYSDPWLERRGALRKVRLSIDRARAKGVSFGLEL
jgi:cysteine synthase A